MPLSPLSLPLIKAIDLVAPTKMPLLAAMIGPMNYQLRLSSLGHPLQEAGKLIQEIGDHFNS